MTTHHQYVLTLYMSSSWGKHVYQLVVVTLQDGTSFPPDDNHVWGWTMLRDALPFHSIHTNINSVLMVLFHQNGNTHHAFLEQSVNTKAKLKSAILCTYKTTGFTLLKFGSKCLH